MSEATEATSEVSGSEEIDRKVSKAWTVDRSDASTLKFKGRRIASASGRWHNGQEQNRFYKLKLYRTDGGRYVCAREYVSFWQGEHGRVEAEAVTDDEAVIAYFGFGELAKEIYHEANIDDAEQVA